MVLPSSSSSGSAGTSSRSGSGVVDVRHAEKQISQAIKSADVELRQQYPLLNYQDLLGSLIFICSVLGIGALWRFYFTSCDSHFWLACSIVIPGIALFNSFLHELEHDLIHNLYFRKWTIVQDIMFFVIWVSKLHSNPWFRRDLHLKHHVISGQVDDAEERLIGLGLPFGWKRLAVTMHPFGSLILSKEVADDAKFLDIQRMNLTSAPIAFIFFGVNKLFMIYLVAMCFFGESYSNYLPARHWWWIRDFNILVCIPNIIRQACLVLMSNCSHYYGDIPEKSVFFQNQILDHWILYPFQLFCFNFGATHIIHHYVPGQPFYIRQLVYWRVRDFMVSLGVRLNDFDIVSRANRYCSKLLSDKKNDDQVNTDIAKQPCIQVSEKANIDAPSKNMSLWLSLCTTVGFLSYAIFDNWVSLSLAQRLVEKYVLKTAK